MIWLNLSILPYFIGVALVGHNKIAVSVFNGELFYLSLKVKKLDGNKNQYSKCPTPKFCITFSSTSILYFSNMSQT